ncbi:MAG TPA: carboxypeptidase-like regulatory domain-containing protein [Thermoanaerobaculia bacterium]|nr:carboxypeptidase-like regulatory domain-containing protein [Thermoanaerobaculia bacterium]
MKTRQFRAVLTLVVGLAGGLTAAADPAEVRAVCRNAEHCPVEGTLIVRDPSDSSFEARVPISGGTARVAGLPDRLHEVTLSASGYWMPRQRLASTVDVWRTTQLRGRFVVDAAEGEMPRTFQVVVESAPGKAGATIARDTRIDCPVANDGTWSCDVPATTVDVILRAKTFTPHYLWNVVMKADAPSTLGSVTLRRGASVVAWLDRDSVAMLKEPARARLVPLAMADPSPAGQRLVRPVAEGTFNGRGLVQLAPVPPGSYSLEVSAPGFATARVQHVEVFERSESTVRNPIRLESPVAIAVQLLPPRTPRETPWRVELYRQEEATSRFHRAGQGQTDESGIFTSPGQAPGRYRVTVRNEQNDIYASRELLIQSPADARQVIELAVVRVNGTVKLGTQPLAAELLFGGRSGAEKIAVEADREGRFHVTLPRLGRWTVDVAAEGEHILSVVEVTVDKDEDDIEIALPNTELSGWVTGSAGERVTRGHIDLITPAGVVSRPIGEDGTFRVRGVKPGASTISATDARTREQSRSLKLTVTEDEPLENIELVLDPMRDLTGTVSSNGAPLAGARVTGYGMVEGTGRQERSVTDITGAFRLSLPETASKIILIVAAAGRTLQAQAVHAPREPLRIELAPAGGVLRLKLAPGALRPRIFSGDVPIPVSDLIEWARANGQQSTKELLELPNMAPGPYRLCAAPKAGGPDVCRDGTLARGALLELTVTE